MPSPTLWTRFLKQLLKNLKHRAEKKVLDHMPQVDIDPKYDCIKIDAYNS